LIVQNGKYYTKTGSESMDFFKLVAEVGFPIAAAVAAGYLLLLIIELKP
jgi:hypothetical protein